MKLRINEKTVTLAFVALIVLAALSWWTSTLSLGGWEMPLALTIAAAKVAIVALVFMDLGEHDGGVRVAAVVAPLFLAVMLLAMLGDIWTR